MHLVKTYTGILRAASDAEHRPYADWRSPYLDKPGLILVFESDSKPGKYAIYFFLLEPNNSYMHTSLGSLQIHDGVIHIETQHSIYEYEISPACITEEYLPVLISNANRYFKEKLF